ncbi:MAG: SurA N-terminal domain-containing protein [Bacteroidota bacterium]
MSNSITGQIRKNSFIVTSILLLFVAGVLLPNISHIAMDFFEPDKINVGIIAGHKVSHMEYTRLYHETRQDIEYRLKQAKKRDPSFHYTPQYLSVWAHESAWDQLISKYVYKDSDQLLGLGLFPSEIQEMVLGNDLPADLRNAPLFQDEKSGKFRKVKYLKFLQNYQETAQGRQYIYQLEKGMKASRLQEKRDMLIHFTYHKTALEKVREQQCKPVINIRLLKVSLDSIQDSEMRQGITEKEKKAYYKTHAKDFYRKPSKKYQYIRIKVVADLESERQAKAFLEKDEIQANFGKSINFQQLKKRALRENPSLTFSGLKKRKEEAIKKHEEELKRFATRRSDEKEEVEVVLDTASLDPFMQRMIKEGKNLSEPIYERKSYVLYRYLGKQENSSSYSSFFTDQKTSGMHRFLKIVKHVAITQEDSQVAFRDVTMLLDQLSKGKTLEQIALQYGFKLKEENIPLEEAQKIGRPIFRKDKEGDYRIEPKEIYWLYNDAKLNKASFVEIENEYYTVAIWIKDEQEGIAPYETVAKEIEEAIIQEKKQKEIITRLEKIADDSQSLSEIKRKYNQMYGSGAVIIKKEGIKFDDQDIEKKEHAPQAIGACFGLSKGKVSQPIAGKKNVMIIEHRGSHNKVDPEKKEDKQKEAYKEKVIQSIIKKDPQTVQDHRYRFRF